MFLNRRGQPFGRITAWLIVKRLARSVGVEAHPHAFRRAVATHFMEEGASALAVQHLLGHARLSTTARYMEVSMRELRRVVGLLELREKPDPAEAASLAFE